MVRLLCCSVTRPVLGFRANRFVFDQIRSLESIHSSLASRCCSRPYRCNVLQSSPCSFRHESLLLWETGILVSLFVVAPVTRPVGGISGKPVCCFHKTFFGGGKVSILALDSVLFEALLVVIWFVRVPW